MIGKKRVKILVRAITYAVLIAVLTFTIFPIAYAILASFKSSTEILIKPEILFPEKVTFNNYITVLTSDDFMLGNMLFNSIWYTGMSVLISIGISTAVGFVFARGQFRGKKVIYAAFSALMFINLGSLTIYPLFEVLNIFHLSQSLWGLVVVQLFGIPIIYIYIVQGFVHEIPKELDDSARIDGCSFIGTFLRIILPNLKPVIATIAIFNFNGYWNSYLMPAFFTMTKPEQQTLIVGLMSLKMSGQGATNWGIMFAGAVLVILPVLIVFAFCNKMITSGQMSGAVKG